MTIFCTKQGKQQETIENKTPVDDLEEVLDHFVEDSMKTEKIVEGQPQVETNQNDYAIGGEHDKLVSSSIKARPTTAKWY